MNSILLALFLATVLSNASCNGRNEKIYPRVPLSWWDSSTGKSDDLLAPWTPMRWHVIESPERRLQVNVWGRTYTFTNSPFPSEILTSGRHILSEPTSVQGKINGHEIQWQTSQAPSVMSHSPTRVLISTELSDGDLRMNASTTIEYDGMIRFDFVLYARSTLSLSMVRFNIPVRSEHATLRHWWPTPFGNLDNTGTLPAAGEKLPFKPYYWIGTEDYGLAWFAESDRNWSPRFPNEAIEIRHHSQSVFLSLNLIGRPLELSPQPDPATGNLRYTFGLQATPVKEFPQDYHARRIDHAAFFGMESQFSSPGTTYLDTAAALGVNTLIYHESWTDIQNYPLTTHEAQLRSLVQACHARGIKLLLYFGYEMSTLAPEWSELSDEMLVRPRIGGYERLPEQRAYSVCYRSRYANMLARGIEYAMSEFDIDGVYLDSTIMPWGCTNTLHGCGYISTAGTIKPTYQIFEVRDLLRRIYTICTRKPSAMVNMHASSCIIAPLLAWTTGFLDGEQLVPNAPNYTTSNLAEIFLPDMFRAQATGRNVGVPAEFLVYTDMRPFTRMDGLAYALLHDVHLRPAGVGPFLFEVAPVWKALAEFDADNATLFPYWKPNPYITVDNNDVKVTFHRHPSNGFLVVAVNTSNHPRTTQLTLQDTLHLSLDKVKAIDAYRQEQIEHTQGVFEFTLASMEMKLMWIRY